MEKKKNGGMPCVHVCVCVCVCILQFEQQTIDILVSAYEQLESIDECGAARVCGALIYFGK